MQPPARAGGRGADARRHVVTPSQGHGVIESVELNPPDSLIYRRWVAAQPSSRLWDRWLLFILVGLAVGLAGFAVHAGIDMLAFIKVRLRLLFGRAEGFLWRRLTLAARRVAGDR